MDHSIRGDPNSRSGFIVGELLVKRTCNRYQTFPKQLYAKETGCTDAIIGLCILILDPPEHGFI